MSGIVCPSYKAGFASPQRGRLKHENLWRGCVGAWAPLLGPSGTTLRDHSLYGNHCTMTGVDTATSWGVTSGSNSLNFDGTDAYAQSDSPILNHASDMTIAMQFSMAVVSGSPVLIAQRNGVLSFPYLWYLQTGKLRFLVNNGTTDYYVASNSSILANTRYSVCTTVVGNQVSIYINGVLDNTGTLTARGVATVSPRLTIGCHYTTAYGLFSQLKLHDARITTSPWTAREASLYSQRIGIAYETTHRRSYKASAAPPASTANNLMLLGVG